MRALIPFFLIVCLLGHNETFAQWDKYPTYDGYKDIMTKFETDYPELCKIDTFGISVEGRKLLTAKVSDNVAKNEAEPAFCYMSTIHGNETVGYILLLRLADYLLSNYGKDERITKLVDSIEIWISPLVNPDGAYRGGNYTIMHAVRYNANSMDLNRNFSKMPGTGDSQNPERETKALMDFMEPQHFAMSAMIHAGVEGVMFPWCSWPRKHADYSWFYYVGTIYADLARENGPPGYFDPMLPPYDICYQCSGAGGDPWYLMHGTLIDYSVFYQQCRNVTLELSTIKLLRESELNNYWEYNRDALIAYMEQVLYGIRGIVTDSLTGEPIEAKIFVENHDLDSSHVYSHLPQGDYYRPIYEGTYDLTFSCDGYYPKTIKSIQVENNKATILDVKLWYASTDIVSQEENLPVVSIDICGDRIIINYHSGIPDNSHFELEIFDVHGKRLYSLTDSYKKVESYAVNWDRKRFGSGIYYIKLSAKENTIIKKTIIMK